MDGEDHVEESLDWMAFESHFRGELLTSMGKNANNQMFPMAWAADLIEAVRELLPRVKHRLCGRRIYANFKRNGMDYTTSLCSGEFEVRKADKGFRVNLTTKTCACKWWDLSGIPCVHAVVAYSFLNQDVGIGVSSWFSKQMSVDAYSYFIKPVGGSSMWVKSANPPPLPPRRGLCQPFNPPNDGSGQSNVNASADPHIVPNVDPHTDQSADPSVSNTNVADPASNQSFTRLLNTRMDVEITDVKIVALSEMNKAKEREAIRKDGEKVLEEAKRMGVYRKRGAGGFREPSERIRNQKKKKEDLNGLGKQPDTTLDVLD
ncbi:zinc finger BED domain-containing protein RICESLEEPER 2 [Tanacetum coccineum]